MCSFRLAETVPLTCVLILYGMAEEEWDMTRHMIGAEHHLQEAVMLAAGVLPA